MCDRLDDLEWYFGRISRHEADSYLLNTRPGTYLVRDSSTIHGDYVLSVSENNKVSHYIISAPKHPERSVYMIGEQSFLNLPQVLDFYKRHFLDTTTLIEPCPKNPPQRDAAPPVGGPISHNAMGPSQNSQVPPPLPPMNTKSTGLGLIYQAKFNFSGKDPEDLPFKKGDILTIIRKDEDQWWLARDSRGQEGLVPANYIKLNESRLTDGKGGVDGRLSTGEEVKTTTNSDQYQVLNSVNPNVIQYAIVTQGRVPCAYDPTQLKLEVGNIIKVLERNVSGNWKGEFNGREGFFPFNRVRLLDSQKDKELLDEHRNANNASA